MSLTNSISPELRARTQQKFDAWDEVVRMNWLESDNDRERSWAFQLLLDPTIYMYAFFKDFKDKDSPLRLYPYQDLMINDKNPRVLFVAANQIGKSITLVCKAVHFALTNPGCTVLMTSKTLPQSKDLLRQIKQLLQSSTLEYKVDVGDSMTKTEIYFKHFDLDGKELPQSRIVCVPATEAALGYAVDLLLIDELAFYDDGRYFFFQIAQPRTYTTKGQIIVFSNPNGQQGILWDLWNDGSWSRYNFNYLDKPGNTVEEYNLLKSRLSIEEFDSTVNAVFTSPAGSFLSLDERKAIQHDRGSFIPSVLTSPLFVFFDFAKANDRTVRIIGQSVDNSFNEPSVFVHEMKEYPQGTGYDVIVNDLLLLIKDVGQENVFMVGWDNTGVGRGIEDFISRVQEFGVMINPVEFSLENKSRIYTLFKFLVEKRRIDLPFVDECDRQLAQLRFQKSGRGYLMVHHESERDRDDFPDALAGLCSLIVQPDNAPVSVEII